MVLFGTHYKFWVLKSKLSKKSGLRLATLSHSPLYQPLIQTNIFALLELSLTCFCSGSTIIYV